MRLSCSLSSGNADSMTLPGSCRTKSFIGLRTKPCLRAADKSTSALAVSKLTACAHTRYFPAGDGGETVGAALTRQGVGRPVPAPRLRGDSDPAQLFARRRSDRSAKDGI